MRNRTSRFTVEQLEHRRLLSGAPAITIGDVTHAEGQDGVTPFVFTVSLSQASSKRVSVKFATAYWSALPGEDYVETSGTLTFASGQTTRTITVLVNGDVKGEENEEFVVKLSDARNAVLADDRGIGTIVNDDVVPPPPDPVYDPSANDPAWWDAYWYSYGGPYYV